ncbi:DUF5602 domain-containing protein [Rhodococcus sp. NPDC127528]|uniref:DUF5602 domain-containing protein n=1 Tax=unclassified Rhodococcus (in: high G+C Gram-positive bacteria) TaxID=192944 RepID=UPI00363F48AB
MNTTRATAGLAVAACATLVLGGCSTPSHSHAHGVSNAVSSSDTGSSGSSGAGTLLGAESPLGNGTSRTYVVTDATGQPTEIGVRLSADALEGLPAGPDASMQMSMLALPGDAPDTGFDHVMLDWNPNGHDPLVLFGKPHFDMHFYQDAVQHDIDPAAPDFAQKAAKLPEAKYVPEGYLPPPGPAEANAVPFMGLHWTDGADNAIPGRFEFTEVLLNGSWDGEFTFIEPMMTLDWLGSRPTLREDVKQPASYQRTGWYPTVYTVDFDERAQEYVIALGGLTMRQAS